MSAVSPVHSPAGPAVSHEHRSLRRRLLSHVPVATQAVDRFMIDPDRFCQRQGLEILKDDRTSTVGVTSFDGRAVVVKRYNTKGLQHALKRSLRVSRAEHCYRNAHRLLDAGILTPQPIAAVEHCLGPVKLRSWYLCEYLPGMLLSDWFANRTTLDQEDEPVVEQVEQVFSRLKQARIAHGDTKATNWLIHKRRVYLLDLDSTRHYQNESLHTARIARDRRRFLRNFDSASEIHQTFESRLQAILDR